VITLEACRYAKRTPPIESKSEGEHDKDARLKEQESALMKLAELYRDQKSVSTAFGPLTGSLTSSGQGCEWFGRGHYHVEGFYVLNRKSQNG
jgi:hypothetical protein